MPACNAHIENLAGECLAAGDFDFGIALADVCDLFEDLVLDCKRLLRYFFVQQGQSALAESLEFRKQHGKLLFIGVHEQLGQ